MCLNGSLVALKIGWATPKKGKAKAREESKLPPATRAMLASKLARKEAKPGRRQVFVMAVGCGGTSNGFARLEIRVERRSH